MKNTILMYALLLFTILGCKSEVKIDEQKGEVKISDVDAKLRAIVDPGVQIAFPDKFLEKSIKEQIDAQSQLSSIYADNGFPNIHSDISAWSTTSKAVESRLDGLKNHEYYNIIAQYAYQFIIVKTDIIQSNSPEASQKVVGYLKELGKLGNSNLGLFSYCLDNFKSTISESDAKNLAKSVLKNYDYLVERGKRREALAGKDNSLPKNGLDSVTKARSKQQMDDLQKHFDDLDSKYYTSLSKY
jgi:hypothetical protein